jgi:general secretion pathway protein G
MSKRRSSRRQRAGFTLMELLLVLAILVVLGSMVVVAYTNIMADTDRQAAKVQIEMLEEAVKVYQIQLKRLPPSLDALRTPPSDLPNPARWKGPYLDEEIPLDPWGQPYNYAVDGREFRIWSVGADGAEGTEDDVDNRQQGT